MKLKINDNTLDCFYLLAFYSLLVYTIISNIWFLSAEQYQATRTYK